MIGNGKKEEQIFFSSQDRKRKEDRNELGDGELGRGGKKKA